MYGFNWGNMTPEEKAYRDRLELQLLAEQAAFKASQAAVSLGAGSVVGGTISFIVQAYASAAGLSFDFDVEATAQTTANINWGDGTTSDNIIINQGATSISMVYQADGDYTVTVTFTDPTVIRELNFPGMD